MASGQTEHYGLSQWESGDSFLREEFNQDHGKIDAALAQKCEAVCGGYTGDGTAGRQISLGFAPTAVIVKRPDDYGQYSHMNQVQHVPAMAVRGVVGNILNVTEDGFRVEEHGLVNGQDYRYIYLAVR